MDDADRTLLSRRTMLAGGAGSAAAAFIAAGPPADAAESASAVWHTAVFHFAPAHWAVAVSAFREMRSASRTHPGNLSYEVFRSAEDPGSFFIVEHWASAAALAAHEQTRIFNAVGRNILNRYAEVHAAVTGVPL
jgi:quinol monooxygenase YgiN